MLGNGASAATLAQAVAYLTKGGIVQIDDDKVTYLPSERQIKNEEILQPCAGRVVLNEQNRGCFPQ